MPEQTVLTPKQITNRAWHKANPDYKRAWYKANKEKVRLYQAVNKERMVDVGRAWCEANPERKLNARAKRRASIIGELTPGLIPKLLESQKWTCIVCQKDLRLGYHVDHIVPVSKGGQNVDDNVQLLCPKCNLSKGNKDFAEFLKARGLDPSDLSGMLNPSESPPRGSLRLSAFLGLGHHGDS